VPSIASFAAGKRITSPHPIMLSAIADTMLARRRRGDPEVESRSTIAMGLVRIAIKSTVSNGQTARRAAA